MVYGFIPIFYTLFTKPKLPNHILIQTTLILSGHNRRNASQLAGLSKGPVIVREHLTYDEAVLMVTETNLRQRSFGDMSHSERAYCLARIIRN